MLPDIGVNWVTLAIGLVVLVVAWTLLRTVLRLTLRIFTLGCLAIIVLGAIWVVVGWLGRGG